MKEVYCFIAATVAAVYWAASVRLPSLVGRWAAVWGMAYGAGVFFVMNDLVLPFSGARPTAWLLPDWWEHVSHGGPSAANASEWWFISNFLGHIFLIGLPVALIARWSARRHGSSPGSTATVPSRP